MKRLVIRCLLRCYPRAWRRRYGEEFAALLEQAPLDLAQLLDALRSALDARWRRVQTQKGDPVKSSVANVIMALGLVALGVALAATGIYIGDTDDAPVAALLGFLLLLGAVVLGVRVARRKA